MPPVVRSWGEEQKVIEEAPRECNAQTLMLQEKRRARCRHPRPMNGIFVAITVMNCTFASSGRLAM